jgi:hypothetical protein
MPERMRCLFLILVLGLLPRSASTLQGQVPDRIPPDQEAQIFNLIRRVTALEEKLAAMNSGTVKAPFKVVDAGGVPILQVIETQASAGGEATGLVIADDLKSGTAGLAVYNKAGTVVALLGTNGEAGGLGLADGQGKVRASVNGIGRIVLLDENDNAFLTMAEDISKADSDIRIGGDVDGFAVEVGSGKGTATLGVDDEGIPELSLVDAGDRERASMSAGGTLKVSDEAGSDILTVAEDVDGEKASVAIGGGKKGGIVRVADAAGKPAAGILGDKRAIVVANAAGKVVSEMTVKSPGDGLVQVWGSGAIPLGVLGKGPGEGGILQISNGKVPVTSLYASEDGSGRWQVNDQSGNPVIEAGASTRGTGVIRTGPKFICGPGPGGPMMPSPLPSCMVGIMK